MLYMTKPGEDIFLREGWMRKQKERTRDTRVMK